MEKLYVPVLLVAVLLISGCTGNTGVQQACPASQTVAAGDAVTVQYVGTFQDGTVFDEGEINFTSMAGEMIPGFDEAVLGMCLGGEKNVTLPPEKAYPYDPAQLVLLTTIEGSVKKTFEVTPDTFTEKFGEEPVVGRVYADETLIFPLNVTGVAGNVTLERPVAAGETYMEGTWWEITVTEVNDTHVTYIRHPREGQVIDLGMLGAMPIKVEDGQILVDMNPPVAGKTLIFYVKVLEIGKK